MPSITPARDSTSGLLAFKASLKSPFSPASQENPSKYTRLIPPHIPRNSHKLPALEDCRRVISEDLEWCQINRARPNHRPIKYSALPKGSHSSSSSSSASSIHFPDFSQNPFFPPLAPQPLPFDQFLGNRFGEEGSQGGNGGNSVGSSVSSSVVSTGQPGSGVSGTFSSSVHGSTNVNGNQENFHVSTTGVHENGQVTSVQTVHKP